MSDEIPNMEDDADKMLPEYNFSDGVRGKHAHALHCGCKIVIHRADGTTEEQDCFLPARQDD